MFQDTAYGQNLGNTRDYGLYWVKNQGYEIVVEFHLDAAGASASGGHVIIPAGLPADSIDVGIQNAVKKHVGVIRGITGRNNLLNCNVAKQIGINYRLVELGFITNKQDMDTIKKNINAYCKDIASAIHGATIKGQGSSSVPKSPSKPPQKKIVDGGWNKNQYGILWKKQGGSFTCSVPQGIVTRRVGPSRQYPIAGVLKKGQTVNFSEVQKFDGFYWISWMTNAGYEVYMPIATLQSNGAPGKLWGDVR